MEIEIIDEHGSRLRKKGILKALEESNIEYCDLLDKVAGVALPNPKDVIRLAHRQQQMNLMYIHILRELVL